MKPIKQNRVLDVSISKEALTVNYNFKKQRSKLGQIIKF